MRLFSFALACCTLLIGSFSSTAMAASIVGLTADAELNGNNSLDAGSISAGLLRVGTVAPNASSSNRRNAIFVFDLSSISGVIDSVDLQFFFDSKTGSPSGNVDLWAVGFSSSPGVFPIAGAADFNSTQLDTTNHIGTNLLKIQDDFVTSSTTASTFVSTDLVGDALLTGYLSGRPAGLDYLFVRLSHDFGTSGGAGNHYNFASADNITPGVQPTLTVSMQSVAVPEPSAFAMASLFGLAGVFCLRRRKQAVR